MSQPYPPQNPGWHNNQRQPPLPPLRAAARPGSIPLRPLKMGDFFESVFTTFRHNAGGLIIVALIMGVISALVSGLSLFGTLGGLSQLTAGISSATMNEDLFAALSAIAIMVASIVSAVVSAIVSMVLYAMVGISTMRSGMGLKTRVGQLFQLFRGSWWKIIGFSLITLMIGVALLFIGLGIPFIVLFLQLGLLSGGDSSGVGVSILVTILTFIGCLLVAGVIAAWLYIRLLMAPVIMSVEGRGVFASMKRSWNLTQTRWWRTFGIIVLFAVIVSIASSVITGPISLLAGIGQGLYGEDPDSLSTAAMAVQALTQAASVLISTVASIFLALVVALLYFDARAREEGLHIHFAQLADMYQIGMSDRFNINQNSDSDAERFTTWIPGRENAFEQGNDPGQDPGAYPYGQSAPFGNPQQPPQPPQFGQRW